MSQNNPPQSFPPPKRSRRLTQPDSPPSYSPQQRRPRPGVAGNPAALAKNETGQDDRSFPPSFKPVSRPAISKRLRNSDSQNAAPAFPPATKLPTQNASTSRFAGRNTPVPTRIMSQNSLSEVPQNRSVPEKRGQLEPIPSPKRRKTRSSRIGAKRIIATVAVLLLVFVITWPFYLCYLVDSQLNRVDALSNRSSGEGETWLIAGSDKRSNGADGGVSDATKGARTDSIMLVRKVNSTAEVVSLPRDSAVTIPGHGLNKLNASYAFGGPKLLVRTVEELSGVKIDHYLEVTMGAVIQLVDAVGGVELCLDYDVDDHDSGLKWKSGCHQADGATSLAFSRMRHQDPKGDIGRAERQRQVLSKLSSSLVTTSTFVNPFKQRDLANVGAQNLTTDNDSGLWALGKLMLTYRSATSNNLTGAPPISKLAYYKGGHGAMVQLDPNKSPSFWKSFQQGTLQPNQYHQFK